MLILIIGGSGSGKSAYAEGRVMELNNSHRYYLATMEIYGEEGRRKVERHHRLRADKGFHTIEAPRDISSAVEEIRGSKVEDTVILLECLTNLVANEMFTSEGIKSTEEVVNKISRDIEVLNSSVDNLVIVTGAVNEDGGSYEETTREYIRALGLVNQRIAGQCDQFIEMVAGIPVFHKGGNI